MVFLSSLKIKTHSLATYVDSSFRSLKENGDSVFWFIDPIYSVRNFELSIELTKPIELRKLDRISIDYRISLINSSPSNSSIKNIWFYRFSSSESWTKIILEEKFEMEPEYIIMEPNIEKMFEKADAALIIADNALELYTEYPNKFDLAEEWYDMTGLPFVFAILAGYEGSLEPVDHDIFKRSLEYGTSHLDEICKDWHKTHPKFTVPFYKDYLKENIQYEFGEEEKKGLNLFYDYAFLRNEISFFPEMKFYKSE